MKYSNIFHFKAFQNLPKLGFLGAQIYHLATLQLATRLFNKVEFEAKTKAKVSG
jgi:hypothetical protein